MPLTDSIRLSFGFRDVRGLVANFHQADVRAQREIRRAVKDAGDFFLDLGYFLAPVDSSWMRDHLRARYSDDGLVFEGGYRSEDFVGRTGYDGREITEFYPPLVEDGTRKMAAQPHVRPAFEEATDYLSRDVSRSLRRAIARR
ncbi:MAG TPA: hypothetical protein VEB19_06210 [Gemmatimonadaceae bacterium]|nr:hypothetical protein [Gemmatimonadaceae bacterium]